MPGNSCGNEVTTRVAIVHPWFLEFGGTERVVEAPAEMYPTAEFFRMVAVPLAIFHLEQESGRVSRAREREFHYCWAMENRGYFSRKVLAHCLMTTCADTAAKQGRRFARKLEATCRSLYSRLVNTSVPAALRFTTARFRIF